MEPHILQLLSRSFLLAHCTLTPQVQELFSGCPVCSYQKGDILYAQHNFRRALGLLVQGSASVFKGQGVVLHTLRQGALFGAASVFTQAEEYVSTIQADTACTVLYLPDTVLEQLFTLLPQAGLNYIRFLSDRICFLNHKLDSFTTTNAESRVALYLWQRREKGTVAISSGYAALSRELGIGRASLYRCLDSLEQSGCIERQEKAILLKDLARLERAAQQLSFCGKTAENKRSMIP